MAWFLSWLLVFFLVSCAVANPSSINNEVSKCPDVRYCTCDITDQRVTCSHLRHWDWARLLQNIPFYTKQLILKWSRLQIPNDPLPANYTFPYLDTLIMFGIQSDIIGGLTLNKAIVKPFPNLLHLNFSYSNVFHVDGKALSLTPQLQSLVLVGNTISSISSDAFENITDLVTFHGSFGHENLASFLPKGLFSPLAKLQEADLSGGFLKYVHPDTFQNNTNLRILKLNNNKLQTLQEGIFDNLYKIQELHIYDNPLECSCELHWLLAALDSPESKLYQDIGRITCVKYAISTFFERNIFDQYNMTNASSEVEAPPFTVDQEREVYDIHKLMNITKEAIPCIAPRIHYWGDRKNVSIMRLHNSFQECITEGVPRPFVYWITPVGNLAAVDNHGWHDPDNFYIERDTLYTFIAPPTFRKAHIEVFNNNSLLFWNMRQYFAGTYTCVAINPLGNVTHSFYVAVTTPLKMYMINSVIFGSLVAATFALLSAITGGIKALLLRNCKRFKVDPDFDPTNIEQIAAEYPDYFVFCQMEGYTPFMTPMKSNPYDSEEPDGYTEEHQTHIMEQLGEVRERLRKGMERHVGRIRSYSAHMRASSSTAMHNLKYSSARYMHNFKDTSNLYMQKIRYNSAHYMNTLRSSSSTYAHRMRAGMAMATEQVKSHVQSMKEFCGTGDLAQTVSTVSFQTDVDSQEVIKVIGKQTYV